MPLAKANPHHSPQAL